ncbi:MAG: hypothetical protein JWM80_5474 [Cyanobacteria bacterium RYN_339]|nr:hypothetical protein [Cyanobacteria bacterium RYN_339]
MDPIEFRGEMPTMAPIEMQAGELVVDEGTYVCLVCNLPGNDISLLPGDELPECSQCGIDARWVKV